ncbi:CRISPR-associated protein Cas2 [Lactococcus sp. NH2-7C]|uniref:CRISPR-associated protein Cas2 n=1 Tax=Lactococcus sp. NH2-7C TaxID=2879149 RepID=UPI001CDBA068|nr:CRISPR-associated protein Cas2 [Lactococcus sp. NH2-7C]MCA2391217.1 CRISPR-associated protein Cas2 [Lactococcus sp. NH2-7C]WGV31379.1 CRISPR-associated protein Cas2 [Lactococcus sp. NH2-7C]
MKSIIISYDLNNSGKNYDGLIQKIKSYPNWGKINESVWHINTDDSCKQVRDNLLSAIDNDDSLFVGGLTGEGAWHNVKCGDDYLKKSL